MQKKQKGKPGREQTTLLPTDDENEKDIPRTNIEISPNGLELIEYLSLDTTNSKGTWISDEEIKIDKRGYVIHNGEKSKKFWDGKTTSNKTPLRLKVRNIAGDETILVL